MRKNYNKSIYDKIQENTNNINNFYQKKMYIAQNEVTTLKIQIANGDTSDETKEKLLEAEKKLKMAELDYYESKNY